MVFGEILEFDFFPFYTLLKDRKMPIPLSGTKTLLLSGRIDAAPYPSTLSSAIPDGYVVLPYALSLGPEAEDLILVSSKPAENIKSLGVIKGYEYIVQIVENALEKNLKLRLQEVYISVLSDVIPGLDAYLLYGDDVLRGDIPKLPYIYNLAKIYNEAEGKPLQIAFWIAKGNMAKEAEEKLRNSLTYWFSNRDSLIETYALRRKIPVKALVEHSSSLIFVPLP